MGSVFSPYYYHARARHRAAADAADHCGLNVALYGPGRKRWALTERGRGALLREPERLGIGPSRLVWRGDALELAIDEVAVPLPARIRGRVRVEPRALGVRTHALDREGRHRWWPIAPRARIEVVLERPALRWSGTAYLDANRGSEPLEDAFAGWDWSRVPLDDGGAAVLYDVTPRQGDARCLALRFGADGDERDFEPPPRVALPRTGWRIPRATRAEQGGARVLRTLEDTPFYARSLLAGRLLGQPVRGVHESLSLDRFRRPWVRALLPFRMPRRP